MIKTRIAIFCAVFLAACSQSTPVTGSNWQLNGDASDITFVSYKNVDVAEVSRFEALSGAVSSEGAARVAVEAASVESYVDIRNERLRDMFFNVADYPVIELTAQLDPADYGALEIGDNLQTELTLSITMNGEVRTNWANVRVVRNGEDSLLVMTSEPVLIDAREYGMEAGIEALRDIVGLSSISPVFPVSAYLVFERG
ncbi:YceI family protein [Hyphobacterium sp.]|uniref:YceI family protein n=1 Tax=Hyphobacterium sp. TaxID=2004662 RepID=UPI003BAD2E05